jgi:hypothetical protein
MLEFEFCEPQFDGCECCSAITTRLTRFVTKDDDAYAVYYALMSEAHGEKRLAGLVSLGEWGSEDIPECRVAFSFEMWTDEDQWNVGITDATQSHWADANIVGRQLTREEALKHPWLPEVFHLTDHMTADDPAVREFFENEVVH